MTTCHPEGSARAPAEALRVALVGSPNAGKTSIFNHLTGLRARTGNYPGVTVTRSVGTARCRGREGVATVAVEDLPGSYSLSPVSPDEQVVADLLEGKLAGIEPPDTLAVVVDVTVLERSMSLVAQVLALGKPTIVVLTMTDELASRGGHLDIDRFAGALGVPVLGVIGSRGKGIEPLRALLAELRPDVVLMDLRMPGMDGLTAIRRLAATQPEIAVIILTTYDEDELMLQGLQAGARGFLLKDTSRAALLDAIRAAALRLAAVSDTARLDAEVLMAHALGVSRQTMLLARLGDPAPEGFAALLAYDHEAMVGILALSTLVLSLTYLAVFWLERDQDHWPDDQF